MYIFVSFLCMTGAVSCSGWLMENPEEWKPASESLGDEFGINAAVCGCLEYLLGPCGYGNLFSGYIESLSASVTPKPGDQSHSYLLSPGDGNINNVWQNFYKCIASANYIIYSIENTSPDLSNESRECLLGEAYFYRALCYFNLVRIFGDLPIVTGLPKNGNEVMVPRSPVKEVYEQAIVPDLKKAMALLPIANPFDVGRAHRISAAGTLAKVYCTMAGFPLRDESRWNDAKELLLTIVDSADPARSLSPYQNGLQPDMADLYFVCSIFGRSGPAVIEKMAVENGIESVFELNYTENPQTNPGSRCAFPHSSCWRMADNTAPWLYEEAPTRASMSKDQPSYRFYLTGRDPRHYITFTSEWFHGESYYTKSQMKVPRVYTGETQSFENNFTVMRYAELILLLAEAENELNGPTELAINCVNAIRERARRSTPTSLAPGSTAVDGTYPAPVNAEEASDKDIFRNYIHKEFICEFAFEGGLYLNFLRWHCLREMLEWDRYAFEPRTAIERGWPGDYAYFWPIPQVQIDASYGILTQNEGY